MASCLDCYLGEDGACHRSLLCLSFSIVTLQSLISLGKKPSCPLWSMAARIMDFPMVGDSMGVPMASGIRPLCMVSSSTDRGEHHGP